MRRRDRIILGHPGRTSLREKNKMSDASNLMISTFPAKHVKSALSHFTNAVNDFGQGDWEGSIAKSGKFVEAMLKAIATHCGVAFE